MIKGLLGIIFILCSAALLKFYYTPEVSKKNNNLFQSYLQKEIESKKQKKELPADWSFIRSVKYKFQSEKCNKLLGGLPVVITHPQGTVRLDVTFMDEPGSENIVLVQFNLINLKTNNLVYEFFLRVDLSQLKN